MEFEERVYIERYVSKSGDLEQTNEDALADLITDAMALSNMVELTGRTEPDVVT